MLRGTLRTPHCAAQRETVRWRIQTEFRNTRTYLLRINNRHRTPDWVKLGFVAVLVSHCCGCTQRMFLLGMPAIKTISWLVLTRTSLTEFKLELNQNDQLCFDWKYDNNLSELGPIYCTECHHSDAGSTWWAHVWCLRRVRIRRCTCTEADNELFIMLEFAFQVYKI